MFLRLRYVNRLTVAALAGGALVAAIACGGDPPAATQPPQPTSPPVIQTVLVTQAPQIVTQAPIVQTVVVTQAPVQQTVVVTATPQLPPSPTAVPADKPAPPSKQQRGTLVWAIQDSQQDWGGYNAANLCCAAKAMGVVETLFRPTHAEGPATPLLAESWELDSSNSPPQYVDVTIKSGIEFHHGFGELTADDLVWSINDTNPNTSTTLGTGSPSVTDGSGDWAGFLGDAEAEKIDAYTVRINWRTFDPRWDTWYFGQDGLAAGIVSKKAYDENGKDWNLNNIAGTGPYTLSEWRRGESTTYTALQDHWRKTAEAQTIRRLTIPDETVRMAMLETGEADISQVGLDKVPDVQRFGMMTNGSGAAQMATIMFAGNLWEEFHPVSGEKLEIVTYNNDLAWLGNPWSPNDSNNPSGMDDMEQARLVRTALAMAVDRDLMNEALQSDLGWPVHIPYFDINNVNWDDKWAIPYDPEGAEELLDQAGFPRGGNGTRFSIPIFAWPIGNIYAPMGDAVGLFWEEVGVDVEVLHYEYPVFRPTLVGRSATQAWTDTGPLENFSSTPWDWPRGVQMSALARGGKSHGLEFPEATENYLAVSAEPDLQKRIELNNAFADFLRHWVVGFGMVASPSLVVYNPNSIGEWQMELGLRATTNTPENIVLP